MEYKDPILLSFLSQQGTIVQRLCPHIFQQNGRVEHKHRHILDSVCVELLSASCLEKFSGKFASLLFMSLIVFLHLSFKISPLLNVLTVLLILTLILKFLVMLVLFFYTLMSTPNLNPVPVLY